MMKIGSTLKKQRHLKAHNTTIDDGQFSSSSSIDFACAFCQGSSSLYCIFSYSHHQFKRDEKVLIFEIGTLPPEIWFSFLYLSGTNVPERRLVQRLAFQVTMYGTNQKKCRFKLLIFFFISSHLYILCIKQSSRP